MKVVNWNIEWMNDWFVPVSAGAPAFRTDNPGRGIRDVAGLADRVAGVIRALKPDVLTIQEGPSRLGEMQLFVDGFLDGGYDIFGPSGTGQQRLYVLVRKGGAVEAAGRIWAEPNRIDLDHEWPVDVTGTLVVESYGFTRPPLLVWLKVQGRIVIVANVHSKSKYIHGGEPLWKNEATRPQFIEQAVRNRRRIAAELMRVRQALDEALDADPEACILVAGDFNDGPGTDFFETRYLINNVVGIVAGNPFNPRRMLRHAFIDRMLKAENYTARFDDFIDGINDRAVLLDHILLSPSLYWGALRNATVEHGLWESARKPGARGRDAVSSDHRPQSAVFEFG